MRKLCMESLGRTAIQVLPKRRVRCLVCGQLAHIVERGGKLRIGRHYVPTAMVETYRNVWEGTL